MAVTTEQAQRLAASLGRHRPGTVSVTNEQPGALRLTAGADDIADADLLAAVEVGRIEREHPGHFSQEQAPAGDTGSALRYAGPVESEDEPRPRAEPTADEAAAIERIAMARLKAFAATGPRAGRALAD